MKNKIRLVHVCIEQDGLLYSYAQWKFAEHRRFAFEAESNKVPEFSLKMREAIEEILSEIELETVSDYIF